MLYLSLFVPGNLFLARGVGQTKNRSYDAAENQGERNERDEGEFFFRGDEIRRIFNWSNFI